MDIDLIIKIVITLVVAFGFEKLWKSLFFLIAKNVKIIIQKNEISLLAEDNSLNFSPYVFISKLKKKNRLLSIGKPPKSSNDYISINILSPNHESEFDTGIEECVEAFFRTAFYQLFNRRMLLYTSATVVGSDNFQDAFGSDYKEKLDKCLEHACSIKREYT